ncbi:MAG: glycosyltransferase [Candidatus Eisenbacteria bacterium]|nr:glycosyltransferase [Candidatus Eisenbacteria bacterium]
MEERERRILLVSYYFPPLGGVGAFRAVKLAGWLPRFGWRPSVLTVRAGAYYCIDPTLERQIPPETAVVHAESLDPFRLFGRLRRPAASSAPPRAAAAAREPLFGRLARRLKAVNPWLSLPDNKAGWYPFAVREGKRFVRRESIDLIYTINVPHTSHLIGRAIHRATGVPWVADFRDSWSDNYDLLPPTAFHRAWNRRMEASVLDEANGVTAVNDRIRELLLRGRPERADRFVVVHNGYDPEDFAPGPPPPRSGADRFTMVFVGTFHRRTDPGLLLEPYRDCLRSGRIPAGASRIVIVGAQTGRTAETVRRLGLEGEVELTGFLPHRESVARMAAADLLLQVIADGPGADQIVSGKLYEYMAAGRPVLGIGPEGEARAMVRRLRLGSWADVNRPDHVAAAIAGAYEAHRSGGVPYDPDREGIEEMSFPRQTGKLDRFLRSILDS